MNEAAVRRVSGLAGIAFVVLSLVIGVVAPPWPPAGSSHDAIVTYFAAHRLPFLIGNYLAAVASLPGFVQIASLAALVRAREKDGGWLWIAMLGSVLVAHAVGALVLAAFQVLAFVATGPGVSASIAISETANVGFSYFLIMLAGAEALTGYALWKTTVVPRWIGLAGIALGAFALVVSAGAVWPIGGLVPGGPLTIVAFILFCAWTFAMSVALLRKG